MHMDVFKNIVIPVVKKELKKTTNDLCDYIVYGYSKNTTTCTGGSAGKTTVIGPVVLYRP